MADSKKSRDTPKSVGKPRKCLTQEQRVQIFTLRQIPAYSYTQISKALNISRSTVRKVLESGFTTPKKPKGRPCMLDIPLPLRLTRRATLNAYHRRLTYEEIADLEGIRAYRRTLTLALEKELYFRRVATEKPLLTDAYKKHALPRPRLILHGMKRVDAGYLDG
jgi:transposase